ncbi:ATP-binding protein [Actinoplanes sp. KI2]|uniref:ATP-binding protein n=1 Tax=Actinoplanes sp. KI2 TaxID=2983315 RepID=UPI0021D5D328|nr:ATP-binding protein [Actinoplanes sp. KI2]MCU7722862.1 ATP-binding protein [Actinoplanes sp. KI2]
MSSRASQPGGDSTDIGRLLRRTFGVLVALVLLMGVAGLVSAVPPFSAVSRPLTDVLRTRAAAVVVRALLFDGDQGLDGYLLTGDPTDRAAYEAARRDYPAAEARLRAVTIDQARSEVENVAAEADRWWAMAGQQIAAMPADRPSIVEIQQGQTQFARVVSALRALDRRLVARITELNRTNNVLNAIALAVLTVTTVLAGLLAVRIGRSAVRRITNPLGQMLEALDRMGRGDHEVRVTLARAPTEIEAVAAAVNATADEASRERRMFDLFQEHSAAVRDHLSRGEAVAAAAQALGDLLDADHVVIRLAPDADGQAAPQVWSAAGAPGDPTVLAGTTVDWAASMPGKALVRDVEDAPPENAPPENAPPENAPPENAPPENAPPENAPPEDAPPENAPPEDAPPEDAPPEDELSGTALPEAEVAALRTAGAGLVIALTFGEGRTAAGRLTVVRQRGRAPWRPYEVHMASMLAADLARVLTQAKLFEHTRELVARMQEVDAAKTEFLSTVSHELRTPLTSVSGYLEVLVDQEAGPLNLTQERMLGVIDNNVERLRLLIEDLLLVSRIEAGRLSITDNALDLGRVAREACAAVQPTAEKAGVTLTCVIDQPITIRGDLEHLDRVVLNVLSNAVKFTPSGGTVTVTAHTSGAYAVLTVQDTGIGIPADDLPHLFTRFFRAGNAVRQAIPGTGLGLAIVSSIVERHGGTVTLDSEEGVGTTVTIRLPITQPGSDRAAPDRLTNVHEYSAR